MNKRITTFELAGGIGNQLFQVIAGVAFSLETGNFVQFDVSRIGSGTSHRKENVLGIIDLSDPVNLDLPISRSKVPKIVDYLVHKSSLVSLIEAKARNVYQSKTVGYDANLLSCSSYSNIRGYFQSYRYFNLVKERGLEINFVDSNFSPTYQNFLRVIDFEVDVAVHIRRGDYKNHSQSIGQLDLSFFTQGLKVLNPAGKVYIFSDEGADASLYFQNYETVQTPELLAENPFESLILMSKFKNLIISNSTFSWWSASLGRSDKNVVHPQPWFRCLDEPFELLPTNWIGEESRWVDDGE